MEVANFSGLVRASASEKHPLQSVIEFVFTDFNPNRNKQGVEASEADNIIRTGLNQPVKVNFLGDAVANHQNTLAVGTIVELHKTDEGVIGTGILWKENEALIKFLEKASASEGGVQFSWELYYKTLKQEAGTDWLQDVVVGAITIVDTPAYSGRTPLLSIAEDMSGELQESVGGLMDPTVESLTDQVNQLSDKLYGMVNQLYEALEEARPDPSVTDLDQVVAEFSGLMDRLRSIRTDASTASATLSEAQSELEVLRTYKQDREAVEARSALVEARTSALSSIMSPEDITEKLEFILGLSEEVFTQFVASIQTVLKKSTSSVDNKSLHGAPDFVSHQRTVGQFSIKDVAQEFLKQRGTN